eukprot:15364986-Ditylum_brightwellii.AAC.3
MIAIAHTMTRINIAQAGTAMTTAKTPTQAEIVITISEVAAMQKNCHLDRCYNHCDKGGQEGHSHDDRQKGDHHHAGNQGQSHHMEEKRSCFCSQSKTCSHSCSHSHSHSSSCNRFSSHIFSCLCSLSNNSKQSYDNYHVKDPNMDLDE